MYFSHHLLLFQEGLLRLSEALAMPCSELTADVVTLGSRADFPSTRAAADKVAINYKCICFADYPSLLSDSWLFRQLILLLSQLLARLLIHLSDRLIDLHALQLAHLLEFRLAC